MRYEQALGVARDVVERLAPWCERIEIAGSIRRGKREPRDVEIVFWPREVASSATLFDVCKVPATDRVIADLIDEGFWEFDQEVKRNGPRYKRLIHTASGAVIEMFRADADNWGYIYALRTGPGDFNKALVSKPWQGGILPLEIKVEQGYVYRRGVRVPVPDEATFFELWELPYLAPDERSAARARALAGQ
jgi:DNA polymerase/3'-5' exonuclease PolX